MTTMPALEAYRQIARVYDSSPNPVITLERRVLAPMLPELPGLGVVDVGAGTGFWAMHCARQGARSVALDRCAEMLNQAAGLRAVADARQLPLRDDSADVVICSMMLGYARRAFSELARIVKPGGSLFVTDLHPEALASGWSRSFRVGGTVIHPAHDTYAIDELQHERLLRREVQELAFDEPERAIFERAGKPALFEQMASQPAIFIARWSKSC